jgi:hypothetical protein
MKNLIILLLLLAAIPACEIESYLLQENEIEIGNIYDYDFEGSEEIPEFENIFKASIYVMENSIYIPDIELYHKKDYWQTPEEFYYNRNSENKMQGDCEDYSIFLGYILYFKMGYKDVKILRLSTTKSDTFHIIIYCDNWYIEPQSNIFKLSQSGIEYIILYTEVLWMTINYHDSIGEYQ